MAPRGTDPYTTIESSVVDELSEILSAHIRLQTATPLFMCAAAWRACCLGLPRLAHLVAYRCGFRLDSSGEYFDRRPNLPLAREERGVDLLPIRRRIAAVIDSLDPAGVLLAMKAPR